MRQMFSDVIPVKNRRVANHTHPRQLMPGRCKKTGSRIYILPAAFLLDAFKAFTFFSSLGTSSSTWVAKLHLPIFHFISG
jgi:hypothetical protein